MSGSASSATGGGTKRNRLNLTLPTSVTQSHTPNAAVIANSNMAGPLSNDTPGGNPTPQTVIPARHPTANDLLPDRFNSAAGGDGGAAPNITSVVGDEANSGGVTSAAGVQMRTNLATAGGGRLPNANAAHPHHYARRPLPPPLTSTHVSGSNNRISTGPVDVAEVLRRLEAQDLDAHQRQRLSAFVAEKQKIGELRPEDFDRLSELGKGNGGVVSRVRHTTTGLIMAKKNIHLEIKPAVKQQIIRELQVLHDCNSPYIVGYYGAFFADGDISLCMEYMDGGSLDIVLRHAGRIPEPIVAKILYSVLKGLVYLLEALHIIHRDVKPSNILVKRNGEVKLCDFGVSGQLIDSLANSFVGTRSYMAPERLTGEQYNISSDVWSVGLSLVELTTGRYPIPAIEDENVYLTAFSRDREENLAQHLSAAKEGKPLPAVAGKGDGPMAIFEQLSYIVDQPPPRLPHFCFSNDLIDLVDSCLRRPPNDRPSLEKLLQHPFVVTVAGCCLPGTALRQSVMVNEASFSPEAESADPINLGRYLCAVLPPLSVDELSNS